MVHTPPSVVVPDAGIGSTILNFLIGVDFTLLTFSRGEKLA
jgi:hypothetical protein